MLAVSQGLMVGFATLYAYCFRFSSKQNARLVQSLQWLCLYSGCSSLYRASAQPDPGWPRKTAATVIEVIYGWSVSGAVFYYVIITARCRRSVHCLLAPISLSQTSSSDAHLETWLRDYASSLWGLWGGDVDNFCVLIIKNCCPNYWKQKNNSISAKKSCLNY